MRALAAQVGARILPELRPSLCPRAVFFQLDRHCNCRNLSEERPSVSISALLRVERLGKAHGTVISSQGHADPRLWPGRLGRALHRAEKWREASAENPSWQRADPGHAQRRRVLWVAVVDPTRSK